jgi:hypothetical protein
MIPGSRGPVVIDTGVFGARLTPSGRLLGSLARTGVRPVRHLVEVAAPQRSAPDAWEDERIGLRADE